MHYRTPSALQALCERQGFSLLRERHGELPISTEEAAAICRNHQATEYPGYYRIMQGMWRQ